MICNQVKELLFQRYLEVEQTAREQATDNVILDQLQKKFLLNKREMELLKLENKVRFFIAVMKGEIIVSNMKRADHWSKDLDALEGQLDELEKSDAQSEELRKKMRGKARGEAAMKSNRQAPKNPRKNNNKKLTHHNVGALVVVKPGEKEALAGIITERDYLRKIIVQGRSSKSTKVGDIMTEEVYLITVTPDTKVLWAMQLMTDNRIRHIPVVHGKGMIGMVSIGDVVHAVVSEHREELDRLNAYIQGGY
ncbi:hypothetical protein SO802_006139 [Lithocarpus litseifolius]|uniref:CBS domain-containing protein n=1 Tax=Lithocarpus litseifolius TaxID=425828 RepID=A0AAW2DQM6_9ROSI